MVDSYTLLVIMVWITGIGLAVSASFVAARMVRSGGPSGFCLTLFIVMILAWTICVGTYPALSPDLARVVGAVSLITGALGWFFLYLSSEYSLEEKPEPLRVMWVTGWFGADLFGLILGLLGSDTLFLTPVDGFGWVLGVSLPQMAVLFLFMIFDLFFFLRFCYKAYRKTEDVSLRKNMKILIIGLSIGMFGILFSWNLGLLNPDLAAFSPTGMIVATGLGTIVSLFAILREPKSVFFLAHDAVAIFVLDAEAGLVRYYRAFVREGDEKAVHGSDLLGGALTAVNSLIRESLRLDESSWVREFSTKDRTFILDARPSGSLVGVLLVSKPTRMLKIALRRFVDAFLAAGERFNPQTGITEEVEKEQEQLIRKMFPFLVIPDRIARHEKQKSP